jgi:hypothetical protein
MFKDLTVLAVVILSIVIVSLCPFLKVVITGLEDVMFLTVTFKIIFFAVVVTVVFGAIGEVVKYNLLTLSIGTTVN